MKSFSLCCVIILSVPILLSCSDDKPLPDCEAGEVVINPKSCEVELGESVQFSAEICGDNSTSTARALNPKTPNTEWNWSVNNIQGGNESIGTISTSGLYIAPARLRSIHSVTVKAIAKSDSTKSASAQVMIISNVDVVVHPEAANIRTGEQVQFSATVTGSPEKFVIWYASGIAGGSSTAGLIDTTGLYTAPEQTGSVVVSAQSVADLSKTGSSDVTISLDPIPALGEWIGSISGGQEVLLWLSYMDQDRCRIDSCYIGSSVPYCGMKLLSTVGYASVGSSGSNEQTCEDNIKYGWVLTWDFDSGVFAHGTFTQWNMFNDCNLCMRGSWWAAPVDSTVE